MENEPRKATDVLLALESKIETLLGIVRSQDFNIKILSNKLNMMMEKWEALEEQPVPPVQINIEAADPIHPSLANKQLAVSSEFNLPIEEKPNGFRRTSRPETYAGDNSYLPPSQAATQPKFPTQIPKMPVNEEVIVPPTPVNRVPGQALPSAKEAPLAQSPFAQNTVPVMQRVVDANGKSLFLADVEILDLSNMQAIAKTRTNGTGKWMSPLPIGNYRVIIRKRESLTKEKLESAQDIRVDSSPSPLELPLIIIKK